MSFRFLLLVKTHDRIPCPRLQVIYSNAVVVFGTPLLTLRAGDAPNYRRRAVYQGGSGTSALVFEYVVEVSTVECYALLGEVEHVNLRA